MNNIEKCLEKVDSLCKYEEIYFPNLKAHVLLTSFEGVEEKLFEVFFDYFHPFGAKYSKWKSPSFSLENYDEEDFANDIADIIASSAIKKDAQTQIIPLSLLNYYEKFNIRCIHALRPYMVGQKNVFPELVAMQTITTSVNRSNLQPKVSYQEAVVSNMNHDVLNEGLDALITSGHVMAIQKHVPKILPVIEKEKDALHNSKFKILVALKELQYFRRDKQKIELLEHEYYHSKQFINQVKQALIRKQTSAPKIEPELPNWE